MPPTSRREKNPEYWFWLHLPVTRAEARPSSKPWAGPGSTGRRQVHRPATRREGPRGEATPGAIWKPVPNRRSDGGTRDGPGLKSYLCRRRRRADGRGLGPSRWPMAAPFDAEVVLMENGTALGRRPLRRRLACHFLFSSFASWEFLEARRLVALTASSMAAKEGPRQPRGSWARAFLPGRGPVRPKLGRTLEARLPPLRNTKGPHGALRLLLPFWGSGPRWESAPDIRLR